MGYRHTGSGNAAHICNFLRVLSKTFKAVLPFVGTLVGWFARSLAFFSLSVVFCVPGQVRGQARSGKSPPLPSAHSRGSGINVSHCGPVATPGLVSHSAGYEKLLLLADGGGVWVLAFCLQTPKLFLKVRSEQQPARAERRGLEQVPYLLSLGLGTVDLGTAFLSAPAFGLPVLLREQEDDELLLYYQASNREAGSNGFGTFRTQ